MSKVCTLTITADDANDSINMDVVYDDSETPIDWEKATQAQKAMNIVHRFADAVFSGRIPNEFVEVIFAMGQAVEGEDEN